MKLPLQNSYSYTNRLTIHTFLHPAPVECSRKLSSPPTVSLVEHNKEVSSSAADTPGITFPPWLGLTESTHYCSPLVPSPAPQPTPLPSLLQPPMPTPPPPPDTHILFHLSHLPPPLPPISRVPLCSTEHAHGRPGREGAIKLKRPVNNKQVRRRDGGGKGWRWRGNGAGAGMLVAADGSN